MHNGWDRDKVLGYLLRNLAARLAAPPETLGIHTRFKDLGLSSSDLTATMADLGLAMAKLLPPTLAWEYPTIEELAKHLATGDEPRATGRPGLDTSLIADPDAGDPIAIIGMSCRFPGGSKNLDAYWRFLEGGADAITEVPKDRWEWERHYDGNMTAPGKMSTRWGGFLDQIDRFDPAFFGISPVEAAQIDPQQRLVLELAWEALEDAGIATDTLRDSATGVFVGAMWDDYSRLSKGALEGVTSYTATGQDTSVIAARVSYTFGLQGPSMTVNTACSSSLVAVHLACQSLRTRESSVAICGGVNLILDPRSTVLMSKFGGMAPDGRSKAFDARANGYVRSEGGGLVVLKPLRQALLDGDSIYCVIRASAVNNDGFSNGLTAPNPKAQEAVLRAAYGRAGRPPAEVRYVEAHGTGTMLGDPIEVRALGAVLGQRRPEDRPLLIGSCKSNMGHLEGAAGVAGLHQGGPVPPARAHPGEPSFRHPQPPHRLRV